MKKMLVSFVFTGALALTLHSASAASSVTLTGRVRDFVSNSTQGTVNGVAYIDDFERAGGSEKELVKDVLGADGTPDFNTARAPASATILDGATTFPYWFHDTPSVNKGMDYDITLIEGAGGVYTFDDSDFFPIDGLLFGNGPGAASHNYSFTFQVATEFTYDGTGTFKFTGDDDVWVFINDKLVIDLGGVHPAESASVDLTTLGLTSGSDYSLDVFFAERHTIASSFRMDTTLKLRTASVPEGGSTLILLAVATAGLAAIRRLKKA